MILTEMTRHSSIPAECVKCYGRLEGRVDTPFSMKERMQRFRDERPTPLRSDF